MELLEQVLYYDNPFVNRNWELHTIARPNFNTHFNLTLRQLRVKLTEELQKANPTNEDLKSPLKKFRKELDGNYSNSYYGWD